jgi:hypothetical protein
MLQREHDVSRLVAMGVLDPSAVPVSERAAAEAALSAAAASVVAPESFPTTEAEEADPKAARRARFEQFLSQYAVFLPHLFPRGEKDTRRVLAVIDGGDEAAFERTLVALHQQASMVATRMPSLASGNNMQACISPREGDRTGAPARAAHQDPNYSVKYHSEGVTTCFTPPVAVTERAELPVSLTAVRVCTEGYMTRPDCPSLLTIGILLWVYTNAVVVVWAFVYDCPGSWCMLILRVCLLEGTQHHIMFE